MKLGGDGVAYAAVLLERALVEIAQTSIPVLELSPANPAKPTFREMARFVLRVGAAQVLVPDSWWLFNHVGIARAQNMIELLRGDVLAFCSAASSHGIQSYRTIAREFCVAPPHVSPSRDIPPVA